MRWSFLFGCRRLNGLSLRDFNDVHFRRRLGAQQSHWHCLFATFQHDLWNLELTLFVHCLRKEA